MIAAAIEALRDDLATGEMPIEEVEHRLTLLADQARAAEAEVERPARRAGLPERLRAKVLEYAKIRVGSLCDSWSLPRKVEDEFFSAEEGVPGAINAAFDEVLAELAAVQPEAPAAGELPAEVEQILGLLAGARSGWVRARAAELRALWTAPPPPAAREAVERAVAEALPCDCGLDELQKDQPQAAEWKHNRACPAALVAVVLAAIRSVELASAAEAERLRGGIEAAILRLQEEDCDGAYDALDNALSAPPPDPLAALMALLAELEGPWPCTTPGMTAIASHRPVIARRLRTALGLPPKEADHG